MWSAARRVARIGVFFLGAGAAFGAAQSLQVSGGVVKATLPNAAPWTTIGSNTSPMRWEMRIHNFGGNFPAYPNALLSVGPLALMQGYTTNVIQADSALDNYYGQVYNNGPLITQCCSQWSDILIRVQRDVANSRYTLEACNATGGGCLSGYASIVSFGPASWAGKSLWVGSGGDVGFLRWFSNVVPVGTPIPIGGVVGDLADWEFEGNLLDSSGHGLNFGFGSGASAVYAATPAYPPSCSAGAQQTFRAGHPGSLDATGSYALDGGTFLSYMWQLASGASTLTWSNHGAAKPQVRGLVFGTYVFQLTVTDSSNQSSVCTVKDGAVATDDNDIVITNNTAVDTLLGPMVRYGANPWPWFDNRHKQAADNESSQLNTYFPAWWDTPGPGVISVSTGSKTVTGVGTTFTTTFCQGPGNPAKPKSGYPVIAVWHPLGSGTGRRMYGVTACTDDTHLSIDNPYNDDGKTPPGSGLSYAADNQYASIWGWSQAGSPGNYYDNVAAYYALYYRSGIDDYLTAARTLADRFWESPMIDQGVHPSDYGYTGRSVSALGLVLRALDGRPDMWAAPSGASYGGLHTLWNDYMTYLNVYDPAWGLWDTREEAYHLAMVSYCALFDTDPTYQSACKTAIVNSFPTVWTPTKFPDGSWPQLYATYASWTAPVSTAVLTQGSTTVTGAGTSWSAAQFPAGTRIWFTNTGTKMPANNSAGDPISYVVSAVVSSTQLTLSTPYQGASGAHGWEVSSANALGWTSQPFMIGILSGAFDLAAKAVADVNPATAALAHSDNVAAANWVKNVGYWPSAKGLYYFAGNVDCVPPISDSNTICTAGNAPDQARTLSAEVMRGVAAAYAYSQDPSLAAFANTLYNAMWAAPGTCPAGSTLCAPDGAYLDAMNDGQYMMATPALSSLSGATPWKWLGMFFGYSAEAAWPGRRVGGLQPGASELMYIGANLQAVPGAASIRIVATAPSGQIATAQCSSAPCAIAVDRLQGDPLVSIQYLSSSGAVLASSLAPIIGGQ